MRVIALVLALLCDADALNVIPRRQAVAFGLATATSPAILAQPASAKSKFKTDLAKTDGAVKDEIAATTGVGAGSSGKGLRGTASASFEANDTVNKNRLENGGVARDKDGKKITVADRNRDPKELGLKTYGS